MEGAVKVNRETLGGNNVVPVRPVGRRRVAVIGAGAAGLCIAKYLVGEGLDVIIYEMGSYVGGQWVYENDSGRSPAYKTLHINSPKSLTRFSDYPFPDECQTFPSHTDMHNYLESYAKHFGVRDLIRFNSQVESVTPVFDPEREPSRWQVALKDGNVDEFDFVVTATGHLCTPKHAPELRDNFEGEYLHSFNYRDPADFARKKVCVVGVGNSAMDVASDVCVTSERTVLVARSGVVVVPKLLMGVCVTDYLVHLYDPWMPARARKWIGGFVTWLAHGRMEQYGFKPVTKATHGTTSATLITHIKYDRVTVKQGIDRIEGKRIYFVDGTSEEFDTLIGCTGYLVDLPFIPNNVLATDETNKLDLYKKIVSPGWPGLFFIGMLNSTTAQNAIFERQAQWITEFIQGRAVLPDAAEMHRDIESKRAYIEGKYLGTSRHALEEEHGTYFNELRDTLREARARAGLPAIRKKLAGLKRSA
jgi:cation diffusion facilitator CzcD-associated flavoprotein CzcO